MLPSGNDAALAIVEHISIYYLNSSSNQPYQLIL